MKHLNLRGLDYLAVLKSNRNPIKFPKTARIIDGLINSLLNKSICSEEYKRHERLIDSWERDDVSWSN